MKKTILFILSSCLLLGLFACSNQNKQVKNSDDQNIVNNEQFNEENNEKDVRKVVWEQLTVKQKEWIDGTWKDGKVSKVIMDEYTIIDIDDKSYEGKEVYLIDFPTKNLGSPNNVIIYADVNTFEYIGNGLLD
ncbi:hypothetical protein SporoP37_05290 [Sporosarcina sp. P37]|uniref:hypothetical protein n=1 Tax=Sporosarcina sp. P37 TaxID=1930546 RepID=UPI000A17C4DF|nr:hypothetical protein [Sporosarcina sp. P37]ARK24155.1 hypothetical protein SporoP37_05290 [Sporosarcina sp. P37]PID17426.1 hypothetical protein CSV62_13705 [Sporosarcina sp. P35]